MSANDPKRTFGRAVRIDPYRLGMARYSQQLPQLFDLPGGLVVDDNGRAAADRLVKFHHIVGNRSRDTFVFPRTAHQVVVFVVEGREYVVAVFVGFKRSYRLSETSLQPSSSDRGSEQTGH